MTEEEKQKKIEEMKNKKTALYVGRIEPNEALQPTFYNEFVLIEPTVNLPNEENTLDEQTGDSK